MIRPCVSRQCGPSAMSPVTVRRCGTTSCVNALSHPSSISFLQIDPMVRGPARLLACFRVELGKGIDRQNFHSRYSDFIRNVAWTLSNLCRGKDPPPDFSQIRKCLPVFASLLNHHDSEILGDVCWALRWVSDSFVRPLSP